MSKKLSPSEEELDQALAEALKKEVGPMPHEQEEDPVEEVENKGDQDVEHDSEDTESDNTPSDEIDPEQRVSESDRTDESREDSEGESREDEPEEQDSVDPFQEVEEATEAIQFEDAPVEEKQVIDPKLEQLQQTGLDVLSRYGQIQNYNLADHLPKDPTYYKDGKWVFVMEDQELNDYLIELRDNGQEFAASKIQNDYFEATKLAQQYQTTKQQVEQEYNQFQQTLTQHHNNEWVEVGIQVRDKFPDVSDVYFQRAQQLISKKAQVDQEFASSLQTAAGKMKAGLAALNASGAFKKLKTPTADTKQMTPDVKGSRGSSKSEGIKKVKSNKSTGRPDYSLREIMNKKQENTYSSKEWDEILDAAAEGRVY